MSSDVKIRCSVDKIFVLDVSRVLYPVSILSSGNLMCRVPEVVLQLFPYGTKIQIVFDNGCLYPLLMEDYRTGVHRPDC